MSPLLQALLSDGRARTVARRTLTLSFYLVASVLVFGLLPLWMALAALGDLARHRDPARRWPYLRTLGFFVAYLGCEAVGVAVAFGLWILRPLLGASGYVRANFRLQCWWGGTLFRMGGWLFNFRTEVTGGEALEMGGPLLLYIRHSSMADTVLAVNFISSPSDVMLRYVLKRTLLFDPCLDIVGNRLPNRFSRHATARRQQEIDAVAALADDLGPGDGVLIYPEGTRFSAAKRERQNDKLKARAPGSLEHRLGVEQQHTLLPRRGGPLALLERNSRLDNPADLVFCAHTGFEGSASFDTLANGALIDQTIQVHFWRVKASEVPADPDQRFDWLLREWSKVDAFIRTCHVNAQGSTAAPP